MKAGVKMIYIALCDDEPAVCDDLKGILINYAAMNDVEMDIASFHNGEDLHESLLAGNYFDLIFLDIELYRLNGVDLGHWIREELDEHRTAIVYISAQKKYAMELFSVQPLDFLVKPVSAASVCACVDLMRKIKAKDETVFQYRKNGGTQRVPVGDIYYFESDGRKVEIFYKTGSDHFYEKLDEVEKRLEKEDFLRIHQSFLVNYHRIISNYPGKVILCNGTVLPVSRGRQKEMMQRMLELQGMKRK